MTQKEIDKQIEAIKTVTANVLAGGKESCLQFLMDAGIIGKPLQSKELEALNKALKKSQSKTPTKL